MVAFPRIVPPICIFFSGSPENQTVGNERIPSITPNIVRSRLYEPTVAFGMAHLIVDCHTLNPIELASLPD